MDKQDEMKAMDKILGRGLHKKLDKMYETGPQGLESAILPGIIVDESAGGNMLATLHKTPIVIYHGNCADGFSAAWVFYNAQKQMQQSFDFYAAVYNDDPPDVTDRVVYLVDFSYKKDVVKQLCKQATAVYLIDHHQTAIEDLMILGDPDSSEHQWNFHMYMDMDRSGAMLAWDFIHNVTWGEVRVEPTNAPQLRIVGEYHVGDPYYKAPPMLLEHIQDRDLWKFKLAGTREIQSAVMSYEYTFENWDKLMGMDSKTGQIIDKLQLWREGAAIERKHHKDVAELVKVTKRTMRIADYEVPVANISYIFASDAGSLMAKEFRDGTLFAATYFDTSIHRVFSLRSTERGVDVAAIAKLYNGGGHKHAAGFRVPRNHALAMI